MRHTHTTLFAVAALALSGIAATPAPTVSDTAPASPPRLDTSSILTVLDTMPGQPSRERSLRAVDAYLRAQPDVHRVPGSGPNGSSGSSEASAQSQTLPVGSVGATVPADLDGDGQDEVPVMVFDASGSVLQVRDGATGAVEWTRSSPAGEYFYVVPDIDGDGLPDLLAFGLADGASSFSNACDGRGCEEIDRTTSTWRVLLLRGDTGAEFWSATARWEWERRETNRDESPTPVQSSSERSVEYTVVNEGWTFQPVDLDGDGVAELVFNSVDSHSFWSEESDETLLLNERWRSSSGADYRSEAWVESLDGRVVYATAEDQRDARTTITAAGDLTGDGRADLLETSRSGYQSTTECRGGLAELDSGCTSEDETSTVAVTVVDGATLSPVWSWHSGSVLSRLGADADGDGGGDLVEHGPDGSTVVSGATGEPIWQIDGYLWSGLLGTTAGGAPLVMVESYRTEGDPGAGTGTGIYDIDRVDARTGEIVASDRFSWRDDAEHWGYAYASAFDDHDGDGIRDLLVVSIQFDDTQESDTIEEVLVSATGGELRRWAAPEDVSPLGDLDGDGAAELLVRRGDDYRVETAAGALLWTRTVPRDEITWVGTVRGPGNAGVLFDTWHFGENGEDLTEVVVLDGVTGAVRWQAGPFRGDG